jgi:plastocyanin
MEGLVNKRSYGSTGNLIILSLVVVAVGAGVTLTAARAQQPSETEDMRRELRQVRSQIQALRAALSEAAELDYKRAAALSRALNAIPGVTDSSTAPRARDEASEKPRASAPAAASPLPAAPALSAAPPSPPPAAPVAAHPGRRSAEGSKRAAEPAATGTIKGKVSVPKGEPVAYVYVENVSGPAVKDQRVTIEQVGKRFVPAWAVVQRGTVISFPNRDNIYHNVFSLSSGNSFDLGLYSAGEAKTHAFNEPGEVEIYCNIHPQMAASALVVPNRLFAKLRPDGTFEIPNVPVGRRKVVAWAPGSRLTANWVDLDPGQPAQIDLKLESKASGHKNKAGQAYGSYE